MGGMSVDNAKGSVYRGMKISRHMFAENVFNFVQDIENIVTIIHNLYKVHVNKMKTMSSSKEAKLLHLAARQLVPTSLSSS